MSVVMVEMDIGGQGTMVFPDWLLNAVLINMFLLFAYIGFQSNKLIKEKASKEAQKAAKAEKKRTGSGKGSRKDK